MQYHVSFNNTFASWWSELEKKKKKKELNDNSVKVKNITMTMIYNPSP